MDVILKKETIVLFLLCPYENLARRTLTGGMPAGNGTEPHLERSESKTGQTAWGHVMKESA